MSIRDNEPCIGAFPPDREPALCEKCGKAEALPNDEWCRACADHEFMRDLLSGLTAQEQDDIVAAGRS